jgi:hypothetical protein
MVRSNGFCPSTTAILIALFVLSAGPSNSAFAAKTIYKCTKNGQVTLTDKPCDGATSDSSPSSAVPQSGATTIASSSTPSPVGEWSGQQQYHGVENGEAMLSAHTVVLGTLEFTADGKVSGSSAENGCTVLGVWSQGTPASIVWLDVTLDGCRYVSLNRRYHGSFLLARPDSSGDLNVQAIENPHLGQMKARMFDIKGTLRRSAN